ncbi:hypothetical protein KIPB_012006, partial [Kipferlia bialata]|eukprot:g12006.t1
MLMYTDTQTVVVGNRYDQERYSSYVITPDASAVPLPSTVGVTPSSVWTGQLMIEDLRVSLYKEDGSVFYMADATVLVSLDTGDQTSAFWASPDPTLSCYGVPYILLPLAALESGADLDLTVQYYSNSGVTDIVNTATSFQHTVSMPIGGGTPASITVDPLFLGWQEDGEVNDFTIQLVNEYGAVIADG